MFTSIFGIVAVLKQMSAKDRMARKKYMGLWRWESEMRARTMTRFPRMVTRYMVRNRQKKRGCSYGSTVNSRRVNSETSVLFLGSILLMNLM